MRVRRDIDQKVLSEMFYQYLNVEEDFVRNLALIHWELGERVERAYFDLSARNGRGREYPIVVLRSPAGEARGTMHFPFDEVARITSKNAKRVFRLDEDII